MSPKKIEETECYPIDKGSFVFNHEKYTVIVNTSGCSGFPGVHLQSRQRISNFLPQKKKPERFLLPMEEVREIVALAEESDRLKKKALKKSQELRKTFGF